ncbi:MAG: LysR family transcriptional regulator [Betaproteobacteria bacterium]|nr:LysR family transcriptional regulator [Betaproteobacteria bacterium]MBU6511089.1 LysR family transcriptional regulator [Betaproteobacteria bacterium]MDE1955492.1 LysR family transcriptional regulator [Betaproteobacteria bacterium]MDE2151417.1 LysR family transcriptional regulator [Betaproteobacteria bacterium]
MISLRMLRTFQAVARSGSFAAAAGRVALTQAAVSQQMRAFEQATGRELFDRRARRIALTREGRDIQEKVEQILALVHALPARPADPMSGSVSIGAVVSVIGALSLAVAELKRRHPALEVRLSSARSAELVQMVRDEDLDFAVVVGDAAIGLPEALAWTPIYDEPLVLLASAATSGHDPRDILRARPFLRFDLRVPTGAVVDRAMRALGLQPAEYLVLNSIETIVSLVAGDVGVSVLPELQRGHWRENPRLRVLPLSDPPYVRTVGMIHRRTHPRSALAGALAARLRGGAEPAPR